MTMKPLKISVPEYELQDLNNRLRNARLPSAMSGLSWEDGTEADYLEDLTQYWAKGYQWRKRESLLNSYPHYSTQINGLEIHFIYQKGTGLRPVPLLLMHGWPSSFVQFLDILPLLTAPESTGQVSFDVVIPSIPGYPLSEKPKIPGMNFLEIAKLCNQLMTEILGYQNYAARGSDQGAMVQQQIGLKYPERLIGLHRSGINPFFLQETQNLSEEEKDYLKRVSVWKEHETLYARMQSQRPETLVPALSDSPSAMAAWFIEKFQRWGDAKGDIDAHFSRDKLLDNLSLHWFFNSAASATRIYHQCALSPGLQGRVEVPTGIIMPLSDRITLPAPRAWAERQYQLASWKLLDKGGHFPEWEHPQMMACEIRSFFYELLK